MCREGREGGGELSLCARTLVVASGCAAMEIHTGTVMEATRMLGCWRKQMRAWRMALRPGSSALSRGAPELGIMMKEK